MSRELLQGGNWAWELMTLPLDTEQVSSGAEFRFYHSSNLHPVFIAPEPRLLI